MPGSWEDHRRISWACPFEGSCRWTEDPRRAREIRYYVNDRHDVELKNHRLVVTDDDITGTFIFPGYFAIIRRPSSTLAASDAPGSTTSSRTARSCGGEAVGIRPNTRHFCSLKEGLTPPRDRVHHTERTVVAEQVGAQIFSEVWGLISPGTRACRRSSRVRRIR